MAPRQGIEPRPKVLETLVLPEHLRDVITHLYTILFAYAYVLV